MKFLSQLWFSVLPFLDFIGLYGLIRTRVGGFLGNFFLQILESWSNIITFGLLFIKFGLQLEWHPIVTILGLLELHSCLMDLCQNIEILMLVHGTFSCPIEDYVVLFSHLFDLGLQFLVLIYDTIICIFSLSNCHL